MRRARSRLAAAACGGLALPLLLATAAPAGPDAEASLARGLLVNGDSLAVGTQPYLPRELRSWKVVQSVAVSRHAPEGAGVMRSYGRSLPRVIHVSLGTNDDPRAVSSFRDSIRAVMNAAGPRRCVVWTNIVRPPVAGASYAGYNHALAEESRSRETLRVVNWARMVRENPQWLVGDGVHVSAEGYEARARAVARSVRRCR
jgi:NADH:ubiquinone oxidoreductase subunit